MSEKRRLRAMEAFDADLKDIEGFREAQERRFAEMLAAEIRKILSDGKTHAFTLHVEEECDENQFRFIHRETISDEEVIRCRDCKFATINTSGMCKYCEVFWRPDVDGYGADPQVNLPGDFFCAWAERTES